MPRPTTQEQRFSIFGELFFTTKIKPSISFEKNKNFMIDDIISNNQILQEIVISIDSVLSANSTLLSNENKDFLKNLKKKLSGGSNDQEINEKETDFLQKSIQFVISGKPLTAVDEKHAFCEYVINNDNPIPIVLNLMRGFNYNNEENGSSEDSNKREEEEKDENKTFICVHHGKETTHYCKTCKKLICGFEIVPLDNTEQGFLLFFHFFFFLL